MMNHSEIRVVPGSNGRQFWAHPLQYNVVDDYGSLWSGGVFDEDAAERLPTLLYGHDWISLSNVLGRGIDYQDTRERPRVLYEFDDFDAVPSARQAAAQVNSGTLKDMSVGFRRKEGGTVARDLLSDEDRALGAKERIVKAGWDETSLVVRGAVPGAQVASQVRSRPGQVITDVADLLRRGTLSESRAKLLIEETFGAATDDAMRRVFAEAEDAEDRSPEPAPVNPPVPVSALEPEQRSVTQQLVQDVAELLRGEVIDRDAARAILTTGELPSVVPPAETPEPDPPTPEEPGQVDAPPPVSDPQGTPEEAPEPPAQETTGDADQAAADLDIAEAIALISQHT
jgi:phage head maturation protease